LKIENTLPRYIRLKYMVKNAKSRVTKTVEFAPKANEVSAEDYKGLKDTEAFKGYMDRGDFKEVKDSKATAEKTTTSETSAPKAKTIFGDSE